MGLRGCSPRSVCSRLLEAVQTDCAVDAWLRWLTYEMLLGKRIGSEAACHPVKNVGRT